MGRVFLRGGKLGPWAWTWTGLGWSEDCCEHWWEMGRHGYESGVNGGSGMEWNGMNWELSRGQRESQDGGLIGALGEGYG